MNIFICCDRCTTCRKAERRLEEHEISFEKRPIKEPHPTAGELRAWQAAGALLS